MHFNLKKAVGISVLPLLGGALAVAAAAPPASAHTWHDTALVASHVSQPNPFTTHGAVVRGMFSNAGYKLTFTAPPGEFFASPVLSSAITNVTVSVGPFGRSLVLTSGTNSTGSGTFTFTINKLGVTYHATETVNVFTFGNGALGVSKVSSVPSENVTVHVFNNHVTGAVHFSGIISPRGFPAMKFSQSLLPAGLVSGNPLVPGTAVPRFYPGVIYTATDALGSTFSGRFDLRVFGHLVVPPPRPGNYGDEVNPFGNGFDVFQQHQAVNTMIVSWPATQHDPATHFIRHPGTVRGAFTFEYAPFGIGTGLSVSDPGFDAAGTGLRDGLVLRASNNGPWQQFIQLRNGTLKNVATGLVVSPAGVGSQLRGTFHATPWGGSRYTWTDFAHLPR
jgi:hypothetical protein